MLVSDQKIVLKRYGFSDDDPLLTWLIAALHELERAYDWPWLYTQTQVDVLAGANSLVLPGTAFKVQSIKDLTHPGIKLRGKPRTWFDREVEDQTSTGTPYYYCLTGLTTIQLWPVLNAATSYQVTYHRQITEPVNDTDTMDVPAEFHYLIVHGAAYLALQAESEEERSKVAQGQFQDGIVQAIARYATPDDDEPSQVTDVMGYGDEYGYR